MFGIWNIEKAPSVAFYALHALQHRGQQGAGIVSTERTRLRGYRNVGLLADVFKDNGKLEKSMDQLPWVPFGTQAAILPTFKI